MAATTLNPRAGILTRLAHRLGRMWVRGERKATGALVSVGLTQKAAKALIWVVKLSILACLLFVAFWLAAFLLLAITGAWIIRNGTSKEEQNEPEWRNGAFGFGLYHPDGSRIDPHNPDCADDSV